MKSEPTEERDSHNLDAFRWVDWRIMRDPIFQTLSEQNKVVLLAFGLVTPRHTKNHLGFLSWCSGIDPATIKRSMKQLADLGFVEQVDREFWRLTGSWSRCIPRPSPSARGQSAGRNWRIIDETNWDTIPSGPGVYVWILDGRVGYVGQSSNLRMRLETYKYRLMYGSTDTTWGVFSSVVLKVRRSSYMGDWLMREARLIHRLQPLYNKRGVLSTVVDNG